MSGVSGAPCEQQCVMGVEMAAGVFGGSQLRVFKRAVIGALMLGVVWVYFGMLREMSAIKEATDFYKFYLSAERLHDGKGMYWLMPPRSAEGDPCHPSGQKEGLSEGWVKDAYPESEGCLHTNLNPPFFNLLIYPLSLVSYEFAWWFWVGLSVASVFASMFVINGAYGNGFERSVLTIAGLFCCYPLYVSFEYGQVTMILMFILVLGWRCMRGGMEFSAGFLLGLAASIKPFTALFLIGLLCFKSWRAVLAFVSVGVLAILAGAALDGWHSYTYYFRVISDVTWLSASWNASIAGFFYRFLGGSDNVPWMSLPIVRTFLVWLLNVVVAGFFVVLMWRVKGWGVKLRGDIFFAAAVPSMLLLSPLGWLYYFPLLLFSVVYVWSASDFVGNGRVAKWLIVSAVVLVSVPRVLISSSDMVGVRMWFWDGALYFYVLLALYAWICILVWPLKVSSTEAKGGNSDSAMPNLIRNLPQHAT